MATNHLDIRVYPIDVPKGNTLAFASVAVDNLAAICGVRVVSGEKGLFVSMPQSQDNSGIYHDIAFPLNADLRKEINAAVLDEFRYQAGIPLHERGYDKPDTAMNNLNADDVKLDIRVFSFAEPKSSLLGFATVSMDDTVAISGIRLQNSDKGLFVTMPQSKDKDGNYHDVAFPLSGDLRKAINTVIFSKYNEQTAQRKQEIGKQLTEGKEQAAKQASTTPQKQTAAKKAPEWGN